MDCPHRECEESAAAGPQLCRYGINYERVDDDLLIAGVVIRDGPFPDTAQRRRALRTASRSTITLDEFQAVVGRYHAALGDEAEHAVAVREAEIAAARSSPEFLERSLEVLRPDLQKLFGQVHDYRQFVTQIIQNINVILESRRPRKEGERQSDILEYAIHEEEAIYWAARLMESKLNVSMYLLNPELITAQLQAHTRLHGLVLKYIRIYQRAFDQKGVSLVLKGESYGDVETNYDAVGVIPHTFLDNALKYAPPGSSVVVSFRESPTTLAFDVSGFGPWIYEDERERIFELFYRGAEAERVEREGMGLGLGLARLVADRLGIELAVKQTSLQQDGLFWTTLTATFRRS